MCEGTLCDLIGSCGAPWQHHSLEVGLWVLSGEALVKMNLFKGIKKLNLDPWVTLIHQSHHLSEIHAVDLSVVLDELEKPQCFRIIGMFIAWHGWREENI